MKVWIIAAIVLATACERASSTPPPKPAPPPAPDPIRDARAEFEILPDAFANGTSKLYSRGDFFEDPIDRRGLDEGDFIGRLRTLFGEQPGDKYVLRHKRTGLVITAYSAQSGPSFGGGPRYVGATPSSPDDSAFGSDGDRAEIAARIAADPVLASNHRGSEFDRHMDDARAPRGFPAVVRRLEALVDAAAPADWETTRFDDDSQTVVRIGAARGASFDEELDPQAAMTFLLDVAERDDRDPDDAKPDSADGDAVSYYVRHRRELAAFAPRVRAALTRDARRSTGDADQARTYARELRGR